MIITAGVVCDRLKEIGVPVTEADKTCVMMAGLLHDAGIFDYLILEPYHK